MQLRDYIIPLRRWWWLIVAATLIATVASFIATRQQAPTYSTRSTVMVGSALQNPNPNGSEFWLMQQLANTYADIAMRQPVQAATMAALGLTWLPEYSVRVVPNTQLLELTVIDTSPERAQAVANELVQQLIGQTPVSANPEQAQRQAFINQQLAELERGIEDTKTEISLKQDELTRLFSARQIADAQTQIQGLQGKLATLQNNYAALLANTERGAVNTLNVIEPAALPVVPVGPNKLMTILLAAFIGLGLAVAAAYVLEYLDDTIKSPDEVQRQLGVTTLAGVPSIDQAELDEDELIVARQGRGAVPEAFRVLRTNLQFAAVDRPLRQLLITSPSPSEGKSVTSANLAAVLARADQKVVIVDADLHRPRLHKVFKVPNSSGLTTALLQAHPDPSDLVEETGLPGLFVLTSGPLPPNAAELLGSVRMSELLTRLSENFDTVIIDSPPINVLSDSTILSTLVDGVLLVVDYGRTRWSDAKRAVDSLSQVNARIVGVLLNRVTPIAGGYYYSYRSGYYRDYSTGGDGPKRPSSSGGAGSENWWGRVRRQVRGVTPWREPQTTASVPVAQSSAQSQTSTNSQTKSGKSRKRR